MRYLTFILVIVATIALAIAWSAGALPGYHGLWFVAALLLSGLGLRDILQTHHSILRNYPLIGRMRFLFEMIRPEIRQYFIESDTERIPFSREQRAVVYQRAKLELDKRPFGTQLDVYAPGYEWINHSLNPAPLPSHDFRVEVGGSDCRKPYSASVFNISGMSFGALSANAIRSLNQGAQMGGFAHDTGEGSISSHHREFGGDLIWQIASGYFGCRDADGRFSPERFAEQAADPQVRMIEIKLSQGAKPGHGGVLPGAKVSAEIARARGVPEGVDCVSPPRHSAFSTPVQLMEFIAQLRDLSGGKPIGFKLAVGHPWEWFALVKAMMKTGIRPDFVVVDGKEGGTGAAPVEFLDRMGAPMQDALMLVHNTLVGVNLREQIRVAAAGKIVSAYDVARTTALGADWCNSARGFMFAIGCIQSQSCHTDRCPTGVATQNDRRQRALVVPDKAHRVANFHRNTLRALAELLAAAGVQHPADLKPEHLVRRGSNGEIRLMSHLYPFLRPGQILDEGPRAAKVYELYWPIANPDSFDRLAA